MLENVFLRVFTKFKLEFYQHLFTRFEDRETSLTTMEAFCMETIDALGSPTINEFATFAQISPSNAAYKVNSLIRKGYVEKRQSQRDKREYHLIVTEKYREYYGGGSQYLHTIVERMGKRFKPRELKKFSEMLQIISDELMPEVRLPDGNAEEVSRKKHRKSEPAPITSLSKRSMRVRRLSLPNHQEDL